MNVEVPTLVLRALFDGRKVQLGDHVFALTEDDRIGIVAERRSNGVVEEVLLVQDDLPFNTFLKLCAAIPPADLALLS